MQIFFFYFAFSAYILLLVLIKIYTFAATIFIPGLAHKSLQRAWERMDFVYFLKIYLKFGEVYAKL